MYNFDNLFVDTSLNDTLETSHNKSQVSRLVSDICDCLLLQLSAVLLYIAAEHCAVIDRYFITQE